MTERFQAVETPTVSLALAVKPVDAVTGRRLPSATVEIEGVHQSPVTNPSGYRLFLSPPVVLPPDPVVVRVSAGPEYVPGTYEIPAGTLDPPGKRVEVYPSTSYSFGRDATLVQGRVVDGHGDPVPWATVGIEGTSLETHTDTDGSFVLAIGGIASRPDAPVNAVFMIDPDSSTHPPDAVLVESSGSLETPTLLVSHPDHGTVTRQQSITESERTILPSPIQL